MEIFPYQSRVKGGLAWKIKKSTADDPWRAELVESAIAIKQAYGPGTPRREAGNLEVENDGAELLGPGEAGVEMEEAVEDFFHEIEDEYSENSSLSGEEE